MISPAPSLLEGYLANLSAADLKRAFGELLPDGASREQKIAAVLSALTSPAGALVREHMGRWIVEQLVPVEHVVPPAYEAWRAPVRDAMLFVVNHLSDARLAPKLVEQLELPANCRPEKRLLALIAKVPGLQKLGQVLARNRHLRPSLRRALSELENGIHDIEVTEIIEMVRRQLGPQLDKYAIKIQPKMLSEASVSAVVRFTWRNAEGKRERGVFKVMKPYIPACFAEDMALLADIADYFGRRVKEYGPAARLIPDTFRKVRRLLQHEVDFVREQKTLREAWPLYETMPGIRVPWVIRPLCTDTITAISEEFGSKVTDAIRRLPDMARGRVADQIVEALVAVPLFAAGERSLFHADPHAGNLLYDARTGELTIIDWALVEHLSREHRRHLAMLFLMVALRDPVGTRNAIIALAERRIRRGSPQERTVRETVDGFLAGIPLKRLPSAVDAMRLLEKVAFRGVRFPAPLIMLSKVMFTLDGILLDIGGSSASMGMVLARHIARRWVTDRSALSSPLTAKDWATLQCSALLYGGRMWLRGEQAVVDRFLPAKSGAPAAKRASHAR